MECIDENAVGYGSPIPDWLRDFSNGDRDKGPTKMEDDTDLLDGSVKMHPYKLDEIDAK